MAEAVRSLWAEPRAPDPPGPGRRDWALIAVLAPAAILEGTFSEGRGWPVVSVIAILALLPTLLWRRTHPLPMVALAFWSFTAIDLASIVAGVDWEGLGAGVFVLLLLYSLFRWGSGREVVLGLAIALVPVFLSATNDSSVGEVVGGTLLLLFVAAVGASVRYRQNAHSRGLEEVKSREREQLARELHDTVAHHVSAIAIQAQAGRAIAASRPDGAAEAALDALAVIEEEASRTLAEMRTMVSALRQGEEADVAPQRGVADIERLASVVRSASGPGDPGAADDTGREPSDPDARPSTGGADDGDADGRPRVEVELSGDLDHLWPSVDAALYRLAQESVTNALRHARHATRIRVRVTGDDDHVRLTVSDDGDTAGLGGLGGSGSGSASGYGLVGMAERAHLLGGSFDAGPRPDGGWTVQAVLPRTPSNGAAS